MQKKYWIMGKNCIETILDHSPERIIEFFTAKKDSDPLLEKVRSKGIKIKLASKQKLFDLVNSDSHQSYVALVKAVDSPDLKQFLRENHRLVLMLDNINDPQNLGAILRAAECFGVDAVIWSKNRGCSLTPSAAKAGVGASELVPTIVVSNLAETVKKFQKSGYFAVTAEISDRASPLNAFQFPEKTLLIMGSEGKGIQPLISKLADEQVYIPMSGKIDSLNVSQATAVLLSHYQKCFF
ncbi:23S rRNA (guanosine-2'-O-)-methyltransferase RlmB [Waddlia chondrophila 2032/99]|uniref:23S rRNA (Guanosine-2'-O-)-methyltransferase RlmB n=2 Tax=Waddlia chondrophila TaxID=71667 RepID=F8LFI0_9BACT|nr:23S rRNA (guanosine-2'-O-)-methyltransferase RlmB [Waddlia chondrophila 2032/99]